MSLRPCTRPAISLSIEHTNPMIEQERAVMLVVRDFASPRPVFEPPPMETCANELIDNPDRRVRATMAAQILFIVPPVEASLPAKRLVCAVSDNVYLLPGLNRAVAVDDLGSHPHIRTVAHCKPNPLFTPVSIMAVNSPVILFMIMAFTRTFGPLLKTTPRTLPPGAVPYISIEAASPGVSVIGADVSFDTIMCLHTPPLQTSCE